MQLNKTSPTHGFIIFLIYNKITVSLTTVWVFPIDCSSHKDSVGYKMRKTYLTALKENA